VPRVSVAAAVLDELVDALQEVAEHGVHRHLGEWAQYDVLRGQSIRVAFDESYVDGVAGGIDGSGALIVDDGQLTRRFVSGDVSVRLNQESEERAGHDCLG
jgi:BirA family biotin operon repressor/biotin-[acetyl-CoA-carboxylase] ligase